MSSAKRDGAAMAKGDECATNATCERVGGRKRQADELRYDMIKRESALAAVSPVFRQNGRAATTSKLYARCAALAACPRGQTQSDPLHRNSAATDARCCGSARHARDALCAPCTALLLSQCTSRCSAFARTAPVDVSRRTRRSPTT